MASRAVALGATILLFSSSIAAIVPAEKYGYGFTYVKGSKGLRNLDRPAAYNSSLSLAQTALTAPHQAQLLQADSPYSDHSFPSFPGTDNSHFQWPLIPSSNFDPASKNRYKNPRNVPSESCPRNENDALAQGRTCLRKCTADEDCRSPRKKCMCDGVCGMSCIKPDRECHELGNPDKGRVFLTGRFFGDRAIYSCEEGYILVGVESRLCQADGFWSATEPSCQKIVYGGTYCGEPPIVQHARHNAPLEQSSFALDTMLQYQCYPGYNTVGFARAKCLLYNNTAMWFGPDVTCDPRSCGEPGDIQHGRYDGDCFAFSCRVTYSCQPGFDLVGRANRYCQADGSWTPTELPTCVPVQCPIPSNPDHGRSIYTSMSYNAVVTYECLHGYTLVGKATRRCGVDKKWSGEEPYCKEINCGHPGPLYNGWIENGDRGSALGMSVIYRCYEGMKSMGASSAICQKDGQWSYPPPQCLAPCVVPVVENGKIVNVSAGLIVSHGRNLTLDCNQYYEPEYGSQTTTCYNGTWNVIPRCIPARCKTLPPRPRHGMVIAPRIEHGSRALYKCKDGFQLAGPNVTECLYGNWTGDLPTCQEIYCPFPGYIENGKVLLVGNMGLYDYRPYVRKVTNNKQIMYECDRGFVLNDGPPGATCVAGKWSPKQLPRCVTGQHPRMRWARSVKSGGRAPVSTAIKNARKTQSRGKGRKAKGSRGSSDHFLSDRSSKSCEPLADEPFSQVEIVKFGKNSSDTFSSGTVVRVSCSQGYKLNVANGTARCRKGNWVPKKPSCQTLSCTVPVIENAVFRYQNNVIPPQSEVPHNEAAEFGCSPGYVVQGPEIFRCWHGEWAVTQRSECAPAPCELPRIQHGDYTAGYRAGLTIANGSTVDYTCTEPDYIKASPGPVRCRLGELTPDYPECKSRNDHRFQGFDGGDMGRNALLEFKGGGDITEGGKMSFFANDRKTCASPTKVQGTLLFKDGELVKSSGQRFPHGTQVTFHCVSGILRDKTTWQIICEDGVWIGRPLNCDGEVSVEGIGQPSNRSCVYRNTEPNIVTFYEDQQITEDVVEFPPGTELVSRCSDIGKYVLLGSVRRRCSRGEWTGVKPVCHGLNQENDYALEKPPTVLLRHQLGPIAQSNDGKLIVYPGTILHMECLWIRKFGTPKWDVSHNYRKYPQGWTEEPGRDRSLEYRLSIYHAQKDDSGIFSCTTPTRHVHSIDVVVRAVHCPPIPDRKGLVVSSKNTKMNSKVHFSCQNGKSLVGAPEVTCLPSGNWNAPIPVCENVVCQDIAAAHILNSTDKMLRVSVVSRAVGGKALFSCTLGTTLRGATEAICLPSGEWSYPVPTCEEIPCEVPEPPENGYIQGGAVYKAGDVVQYHCRPGFMMEGQPIAVCQENGKLSSGPPKCTTACTYPGTTIGGTISSVKFHYSIGETVSFECQRGTLVGSPMLRCLKSGKWSAAIPTCIPPSN